MIPLKNVYLRGDFYDLNCIKQRGIFTFMRNILAIDDSVENLTLIEAVLTKYIPECRVFKASDGREGIELAKAAAPDVILLDIMMPGMDGFEVCAVLKNDSLIRHIPVIFLSAQFTDAQSVIKGLDMGADAYLAKPIKNEELAAQVRTVLRIKEAEDNLRNESKKYRLMTETLPDAVLTINQEEQITFVSNKTLELFGFEKASQMTGKRLHNYVVTEHQAKVRDTFSEIIKAHHIRGVELTFVRQDASRFVGELNGTLNTGANDTKEMIVVIRDISDKKEAHEKILEYQAKLRRLNSNLTLAEEKERKAIAASLHDGLGQLLAITSLQLNALLNHKMDPGIIKKIEGSHSSIQRAIKETKSLTYNLSPPILYELGLISTIKWRLEQITEIHGIKTHYSGEEKQLHLNNDMNILLYRTVSELLNNTLKHADATRIYLHIDLKGEHLQIVVADNGKGFDTQQGIRFTAQHGFGLFSINERLHFVGGSLDITSGKEEGTKAIITAPMHHNGEKENED